VPRSVSNKITLEEALELVGRKRGSPVAIRGAGDGLEYGKYWLGKNEAALTMPK
jgi:hypothetical protein